MKKSASLIIISYLLVYLVWGSTYFFIKISVETIPPLLVVGLRFVIAGSAFIVICFLSGGLRRLPNIKEFLSAALMGCLLLIGGNGLVTVAEQKVDSYIAALVISSTPLAIAIINRLLFGIRPSRMVATGIAFGIGGIAIILYDGRSLSGIFSFHILLLIAGLALWSLATCIGHRIKHYPDVFVSSGLQMLIVGIICLSGQALINPFSFIQLHSATNASLFSVLYLATAGGIAFAAFNYLLLYEPAQRISSYALVNPAIAVLIGLLIGKETPQPFLLLGLPVLFCGIGLLLYGDILLKKVRIQKSEFRSQNSEVRIQKSEFRSQNSEVRIKELRK
jgi:drug/metabolite transporter (DMT)-like permease